MGEMHALNIFTSNFTRCGHHLGWCASKFCSDRGVVCVIFAAEFSSLANTRLTPRQICIAPHNCRCNYGVVAGISSLQRESHTMIKLAAIKLGVHDDANNPSTLAKIILGATHTSFLTFLRRNLVQVPSSGFILRVVWVRAKLDPHKSDRILFLPN